MIEIDPKRPRTTPPNLRNVEPSDCCKSCYHIGSYYQWCKLHQTTVEANTVCDDYR